MKLNILLVFAYLFICSACNSQNTIALNPTPISIQKKPSYATSQPYYELDFTAVYCKFEISVNDMILFNLNVNGRTSTYIPINAGILQSGKQKVTVKMYPLDGKQVLNPNAEFKYNIKIFDAVNNLKFKEQLPGEYAVAKVNPAKKQPYLTKAVYFNADVPYTIKSYQEGTDLNSVGNLKDKLNDAFLQLANIITKGNMVQLQKLIANREKVSGVTMYLGEDEMEERLTGLTNDLKSGFKLVPIPANAIVKIFGNGKLATLVKPNGDSALTLINSKKGEEMTLDFAFYIPQGKLDLEIL
jgi:hypothetical protein